jgi:osmoprotectant transport system permease protein
MDKVYQFFEKGFNYIFEQWDARVSVFFWEHLRITGIALLVAVLIALPLGLLISRVRWLSTPVLGLLNILYTIPSLAFLALLIPITGLNPLTTILVLIMYSQTMLVRNIALGLNAIDPSTLEAARGMGMNKWQVLWKVELPLALPVMIAGLRIASLATISIATVGAWVGADTLGQLFRDDNPKKIAAGIILIALIAIVVDLVYRLIERAASQHRRKPSPTKKAAFRAQPQQA